MKEAMKRIVGKAKRGLAYYPLTFYLGIILVVASGFLFWAFTTLHWEFDWIQLKRWIANNATILLVIFSSTLGLIMVASSIAYKQVIDLSTSEYALWLHQRGTRVLFPIFTPLHDWIRLRSRFYNWWHTQTFSSLTHVFLLVIFVLVMGNLAAKTLLVVQAGHGCSDTVSITANTTWSSNQCHGDVTVSSNAVLTINGGVTADLSSLTLTGGGDITAKGDTLNGLGVIINVDGNVDVQSATQINASEQGYTGGAAGVAGNGPGGGAGCASSCKGGGGAHGGNGGSHGGQGAGGTYYGSIDQPVALGSGGGGGSNGAGGTGGGAIKINAPNGTVTVNGEIKADGGLAPTATNPGGGGSGGSIWIIAGTLTGTGNIDAQGHSGANAQSPGGSGGRIQLSFNTDSSSFNRRQTWGGGSGASYPYPGAAGTIITLNLASSAQTLTVTNQNQPYGLPFTPLTSGTYDYATTTIKDNGRLLINNNTTIDVGVMTMTRNTTLEIGGSAVVLTGSTLTIQTNTNYISVPPTITSKPHFTGDILFTGSGSTLNHGNSSNTHDYSLILTTDGNIDVVSGVTVNVTGSGYWGGWYSTNGSGPGGGTTGTDGGGGGHGGVGGNGTVGGLGGGSYGSAINPTTPGSGGAGTATNYAGAGGGVIEFIAGGTITISGNINANGLSPGADAGGGAGGSIKLAANTIAGAANLEAKGGNGTSGGGCGGGGRIARHYATSTFSGAVSVIKGTGAGACTDGTNQTVGPVTDLVVTGISSPRTAGVSSPVTVEARDAANNRNYGYTKTITFSSTDSQASLPANHAFSVTNEGLATVSGVILKTAGSQTVTADQTDDGTVDGTHSAITVNPAAVSTFNLTGIPATTTAGNSHSPAVTAKDAFANTVTSYTGTVGFSSTDAAATLPSNYTFVGGDSGTKTFTNGVMMKTAGAQTVTVSDGTNSGNTSVTVSPGATTNFSVSASGATMTAGQSFSATVTARDEFNNTTTSYTGTVGFSSTDAVASLPSNYGFILADNGVHVFSNAFTLSTAGLQTITVTDAATPSIFGTSANITVSAVPSSSGDSNEAIGASDPVVSGQDDNVTQTAQITTTLTIIDSESQSFSGEVEQIINGWLLVLDFGGTITDGEIFGSVEGTYGSLIVIGLFEGVVENGEIISGEVILTSPNTSDFNLTLLVSGVVQGQLTVIDHSSPCTYEGILKTTIGGKYFEGIVTITLQPDGSLRGRVNGYLDGTRVSGNFSASSYEAEIIDGTVTFSTKSNHTGQGEITGQVDPGEIQLVSARNCTVNGQVSFNAANPGNSTGVNRGHGNTVIVIEDEPDQGPGTPVDGPLDGSDNTGKVEVKGTIDTLISNIVLRPDSSRYAVYEYQDLASGTLLVVSGLSTLAVLPELGVLTSSIRGFTIFHWFFFAYIPKRRRKYWGIVYDRRTGIPVPGALINLVQTSNLKIVKRLRTDSTGRYGFLVDKAGEYFIEIEDVQYQFYKSDPIAVASPKHTVITNDIYLEPDDQAMLKRSRKALAIIIFIKVLGYLHWPVLIVGTALSIYLLIELATTVRFVVVFIYATIWISKITGFNTYRAYGVVKDDRGHPVELAVVQTASQANGIVNHIQSTITDKFGRFILLLKRGKYHLTVAKNGYQPKIQQIDSEGSNITVELEESQ